MSMFTTVKSILKTGQRAATSPAVLGLLGAAGGAEVAHEITKVTGITPSEGQQRVQLDLANYIPKNAQELLSHPMVRAILEQNRSRLGLPEFPPREITYPKPPGDLAYADPKATFAGEAIKALGSKINKYPHFASIAGGLGAGMLIQRRRDRRRQQQMYECDQPRFMMKGMLDHEGKLRRSGQFTKRKDYRMMVNTDKTVTLQQKAGHVVRPRRPAVRLQPVSVHTGH